MRGKSYMQFYHRRDESEIYLKGEFVLHNALIHAWGMRRTLSSPTVSEPILPVGFNPQSEKPERIRRRTRRWAEPS